MSILFSKPAAEQRSSFQQIFSTGGDSPIRASTTEAALSVVPVYAATSYIADQFASAPWAAFNDAGGVPSKVKSQPRLLTNPGVYGLDLYSWKHQLATSLLLRGNAYGLIVESTGGGLPSKVEWLRPDKMIVEESVGARPRYFYDGREITDRASLIHIPMYVVPGSVKGLSPLGLFRQQIETGLEAQRVGKQRFRRGLFPPAHLKNTATVLEPEQAQEFKRRFLASVSSSEPFVSGKDWDLQAVTLPASDVTFIQGLKMTASQVAAVYRIAPEQIGGETSGSSLTYKSLEQDQIRFNTVTMRPIASRAETVFTDYLPKPQYVRFNLDAGVRADLKTRYEAHTLALGSGWKTINEVRELEELPPIVEPAAGGSSDGA